MITNKKMHEIINAYIDEEQVADRRRSATFLEWFLRKIFHLDKDTAISCICDEKNDKGVDAIYVDTIEEEINIFQSKLKQNYPSTIGDKILRDFEGVSTWFQSSEKVESLLDSTINKELKSLIKDNNLIEIVGDYKVKYNFIINAEKDKNTDEYLKVSNMDLWCIDKIRASYHEIKTDPFVTDTFNFNNVQPDKTIEFKDQNMIITPLLASDIIRLKGIDDLTLFHSNVRFGLGNTRVNKSIIKTLKNDSEKSNFLMFHNGISIVCNDFTYKNNTLSISDYSIVNGAQSTLTFYKNQSCLDANTKVMTKIIKTGKNQNLSERITYYSNNQNSISMRDLRSNDTIQKRLIFQFEELNKKYNINISYVPKRGKLIKPGYIELTSDYSAQLITSCYLKKPYDTHLKTSMFDSKYMHIFNKNITAKKLYLYYKMHEIIKLNLNKIDDQKIANYGLAQFCLLNIIFSILEEYQETSSLLTDLTEYFANLDKYNNFFNDLFGLVTNVFNFLVSQLNEQDDFIYKNYFKNKDQIEVLKKNVINQFKSSLQINRTNFSKYYKDFLDNC